MKQKIVSNVIWRFAERMGAQIIKFIVTIVLARILGPDAYGSVAIITALTTILQVFVDGGLGNALIQKKDADDTDFSSVFFFNIFFCTVVYMILFFAAPYVALFYDNPSMADMIRVVGIIIPISSVKNVQQAKISRDLQFKKFFFATLIGTIISAVVGIMMALQGFGSWSLIAQILVNALIDMVMVWVTGGWCPKCYFSLKKLTGLLSYGWKLLASNLIDVAYGNLQQLVIGKLYSSSDLAYYDRARSMPNAIVSNINTSIDSVLFPVMSSKQDNTGEIKKITRQAIMISNYIMAPLMMGMAFMADSIVKILLTESWLESVFYLRIFCIIYMFQPVHTANTNAIKAMGRSDLFLKIEVTKKIIGLIILAVTMHCGMKIIACGYLLYTTINQIINNWPNRKLLNYKYLEQIKDILPSTILAIIMGVCVYCISFLPFNITIILIIQILSGVLVYLLGSILLHFEAYQQLTNIIRAFHKRRKENIK